LRSGFALRNVSKGGALECQDLSDFFKLFILAVDAQSFNHSSNSMSCPGMGHLFYGYFHLRMDQNQMENTISRLLAQREIDRGTQKRLLRTLSLSAAKNNQPQDKVVDPIILIENLLSRSRSRDDLLNSILDDQQVLKQLYMIENPILRNIVEMVVAIKSGNVSWAKRVIRKILSSDYQQLLFQRYRSGIEARGGAKLDQLMVRSFKLVERYVADPSLVRAFGLYFEYSLNPDELPNFYQYVKKSDSLNSIRELIKGRLGQQFPGLWFKVLNGHARYAEAKSYLSSALEFPKIKQLQLGELWLLGYHIPPSDSARKIIKQRVKKLIDDKSHYSRFVLLELLGQQPPIKRLAEKIDQSFHQPIYNLKRKFYRRLIREGVAPIYSMIQLIKLGDYDSWLLWWMPR
jgi:hypothetical protein